MTRTPASRSAKTKALYYRSATSGNLYLVTLNQGRTLNTAPGYDTLTGVGSLVEPTLATYLKNNT